MEILVVLLKSSVLILTPALHGIRRNASMADNLISIGFSVLLIHLTKVGLALVPKPALLIALKAIKL